MTDKDSMIGRPVAVPKDLTDKITEIVREADKVFKKVGGSSRHWARDCFIPILEKHGLCVVSTTKLPEVCTTEVIDKLFLELSQFTKAKTTNELSLEAQLAEVTAHRDRLLKLVDMEGFEWIFTNDTR